MEPNYEIDPNMKSFDLEIKIKLKELVERLKTLNIFQPTNVSIGVAIYNKTITGLNKNSVKHFKDKVTINYLSEEDLKRIIDVLIEEQN